MVTLIIGSQILKAFLCSVWNSRKEKLYLKDFSMNTASKAVTLKLTKEKKLFNFPTVSSTIYVYLVLHLDHT